MITMGYFVSDLDSLCDDCSQRRWVYYDVQESQFDGDFVGHFECRQGKSKRDFNYEFYPPCNRYKKKVKE